MEHVVAAAAAGAAVVVVVVVVGVVVAALAAVAVPYASNITPAVIRYFAGFFRRVRSLFGPSWGRERP